MSYNLKRGQYAPGFIDNSASENRSDAGHCPTRNAVGYESRSRMRNKATALAATCWLYKTWIRIAAKNRPNREAEGRLSGRTLGESRRRRPRSGRWGGCLQNESAAMTSPPARVINALKTSTLIEVLMNRTE